MYLLLCAKGSQDRGARRRPSDFVTTGSRIHPEWFRQKLLARFEIKTKVVGRGKGEVHEARILNRIIRVTPQGWEYEADQRHGEIVVEALGLEGARGVSSTPRGEEKE